MYPSVFNSYPVIQHVSLKVRHFSTFFWHYGLPGYAPGTIVINVTWMERGFNACQTHSSMYPSIIFNRFPVIQPESSKVRYFSTFVLHILASHGYAPGTIAVSVTWIELKRIQCLSNASQHVPIYLQPFPSNSTRKFKGSPFYHIFCTFCPPWVRS